MARNWEREVLPKARLIVGGYTYLITLRQLHYLLVSDPTVPYSNTITDYTTLSRVTAEGRREGTFPTLLDQTRQIHRTAYWDSPMDAVASLTRQYRRDRTNGQDHLIVLGGEKATLLAQLRSWFQPRGFPIVLLRGYGSQTYVDDVAEMVGDDGRPAVLIYAGDFDPSGEDIQRDFLARCDVFDEVEHIAVNASDIARFGLTVNEGKPEDTRTIAFVDRHRQLHDRCRLGYRKLATIHKRGKPAVDMPTPMQVEVEAIDPNDLRNLYGAAIDQWWDRATYEAVLRRETVDRRRLESLAKRLFRH
jgi:hypothetical protein